MEKSKICITTDCTCDLPQETMDKYGIETIPFHIVTERGRFCDFSEITSNNVLEYIENGHKAISVPPTKDEYYTFFKNKLLSCDKLIHITLTSGMSTAFESATLASGEFDGRVYVIDSRHLSTGMGHMVIKAAQLIAENKSVDETMAYLTEMRTRVSTSFLAFSSEYLYLNKKVSPVANKLCLFFGVHPILKIAPDGRMALGGFYLGKYEKAAKRYIRKKLAGCKDIDRSCLYITHAGCDTHLLSMIKNEVEGYNQADKIEMTSASATVSSNCGPYTFGVLFVHKKEN